jgi:hypothetical protein
MRAVANITPPPAPVAQTHVEIEYRYFVVRGDGHVKTFDTLWGGSNNNQWMPPGSIAFHTTTPFHTTTQSGVGQSIPVIDIPLDLLTAMRLGLIQESELALPEGVKALFNMIK